MITLVSQSFVVHAEVLRLVSYMKVNNGRCVLYSTI